MDIIVNGKTIICTEHCTISDLLVQLKVKPDTVIIERNRELIPSITFSSTMLQEHDSLELLQFVGGG